MNDAIRPGCRLPEEIDIFDGSHRHLRPRTAEFLAGLVRSRKAHDLVPGRQKLLHDRKTDSTTRSRHKNPHRTFLLIDGIDATGSSQYNLCYEIHFNI
jgi:hypothetical protein